MTSRFEDDYNAFAIPDLNSEFGVDVVFCRGPLTSEVFIARRDDFTTTAMGQEIGIDYKVERRDYYLPITSIVLGDETIKPRAGDKIIDDGVTWVIHFPDDSTPAVEQIAGGNDWLAHVRLFEEA